MAVRETAQSPSTDEAELPIPNFIGGEWMRSSTSDTLPVRDPGTGQLLGQVPLSTCDDVHAAVAAAKPSTALDMVSQMNRSTWGIRISVCSRYSGSISS